MWTIVSNFFRFVKRNLNWFRLIYSSPWHCCTICQLLQVRPTSDQQMHCKHCNVSMHQTCIIIGKVEWKPAAANMVHFLGSVTSRGLKLVPAVLRCLPLVDGGGRQKKCITPFQDIGPTYRNGLGIYPNQILPGGTPPFQDIGSPTNQLYVSECIPQKPINQMNQNVSHSNPFPGQLTTHQQEGNPTSY